MSLPRPARPSTSTTEKNRNKQSLLSGQAEITAGAALAMSLGSGIQGIPEGAVISMALRGKGTWKLRSF